MTGFPSELLLASIAIAFYLVTVLFALADNRRLYSNGMDRPPHWAWSLLSAPIYLVARLVAVKRETGRTKLGQLIVHVLLLGGSDLRRAAVLVPLRRNDAGVIEVVFTLRPEAMRQHGYKGAFEIIATVDYMFAFAATTGAVKTHHFDLAFEAFVEDDATRAFLIANNRFGYDELIAKFNEALRRGYWTPRSNSAYALLEEPS